MGILVKLGFPQSSVLGPLPVLSVTARLACLLSQDPVLCLNWSIYLEYVVSIYPHSNSSLIASSLPLLFSKPISSLIYLQYTNSELVAC